MVPPVEEPVSPEPRVFPLYETRSTGYKDTEIWCHVVIDAIYAISQVFPLGRALLYMNKPW